MKKRVVFFILLFSFLLGKLSSQTMVVTDDPAYTTGHPSSILDLTSKGKGLLPPRMTLAQRLGITSPAAGLMLFQTDSSSGFYYYTGSFWVPFAYGTGSQWISSGKNIYYSTGNVGIGTNNPISALSIGKGSKFQVDSSGNIIKINNIRTDWPTAQGAANTYLRNNGTGTLQWSSSGMVPTLTAGSVLFSDGTTIAQDNSNFFWDNTNKRLGVGTNTPVTKLHVKTTSGNPVKIEGLQRTSSTATSYIMVDTTTGVLYRNVLPLTLVNVGYLGRATYYSDIPSIGNNSNWVQDITVPGALTNDIVIITPSQNLCPSSGCIIIGYSWVSAPNTVSVKLVNVSNQSCNPPLMAFYILLAR